MASRDITEMVPSVLNSDGMIVMRIIRFGEKIELCAKI